MLIASTRPVDEFADAAMLDANGIGFQHIRMVPAASGRIEATDPAVLAGFKEALIRLKERERLYVKSDFGVDVHRPQSFSGDHRAAAERSYRPVGRARVSIQRK